MGLALIALAVLVPATAAAWALASRMWMVVRVTGESMRPTYADGDLLLVRRTRGDRCRRRDAVVFAVPDMPGRLPMVDGPPFMVKRVVAVAGDPVPLDTQAGGATVPEGHLVVRGDSPHSVDSRHFGYLPVGLVVGVAVRVIAVYSGQRRAVHDIPERRRS